MKKVERAPTLATAAAKNIRAGILRGELLPGEPLHEVELSVALNISRGTLRESFRLLQSEGLVDIFPHRGAFVAKLSSKKVTEIYTLRALLESYAVRLALEKRAYSEADFRKMKALVKQLGELEQTTGYSASVEVDMQFHQLICHCCGHELLLEMIGNLQSLTLMFILNTILYQSDKQKNDVSHQAVLEAILDGVPEVAEQVVRQHIIDAGGSLVERMEVSK
jgi:DNA-binding GntR family transcriptional regulator